MFYLQNIIIESRFESRDTMHILILIIIRNYLRLRGASEGKNINRRNSFRTFSRARFPPAILRAKQVERDSERRSPPLTPIFTVRDRPRYYRIYSTRTSILVSEDPEIALSPSRFYEFYGKTRGGSAKI